MGALIRFKADTVETAERDLGRLLDLGVALEAEIEALAARLADLDDLKDVDELVKAQAAAQVKRNALRKLDAKVTEARQRLAQARAAARAKLRGELVGAFGPAARRFLEAATAAQEALGPVVAAREAVRSAGFLEDYRSLPIPPAVNGIALPAPDLLAAFAAALDPAPRAPAPRRLPQRPAKDAHRYNSAVTLGQQPPSTRPPARAPIVQAAAEGKTRVIVLRPGMEREGLRLKLGDILAVPQEEALAMVKNGVADFHAADVGAPNAPAPVPEAAE